jgi:hypothetical protein
LRCGGNGLGALLLAASRLLLLANIQNSRAQGGHKGRTGQLACHLLGLPAAETLGQNSRYIAE